MHMFTTTRNSCVSFRGSCNLFMVVDDLLVDAKVACLLLAFGDELQAAFLFCMDSAQFGSHGYCLVLSNIPSLNLPPILL